MGVYEDLLKRKKILEDQQGNVTVNAVVNKNTRDKLTDNSIQTYQTDQESNKNAMTQMSNILKRTAKSTVWEQMQNIMQNKPINTFRLGNSFRNNLTTSIKEKDNNKNTSLLDDTKGLLKLTGLGASTGTKQTLNYVESANENNFNNYRNLKNKQFLTSKNVSEKEKAIAKSQNNLLLQKNGINTNQSIETNLVKKAIQESIKSDEEKIQEEQSKMSNIATQKLGEIAPSLGQMIPGTVASAINPVLGTAYFTTSAGGSYINDAKQRGMTDEQAFKYGTIMGALEGASESVITGQQLSKVSKAFSGKSINKKILNSYGFNIFENAVQEAVMEPAQEITAGIIGDKADWSDIGKRMLQSGFNGALMGAITNGVTYGLEKSGTIYNKIKNNQEVTSNEYKEALQENINKFGKEAVETSIRQGALEKYQEINNITNLQQNTVQNQAILPTQQITQQENKTAQNGNMEQINDNLANNQQTLYNINNESESDFNVINRGTQETDLERDFSESRLLEERKQITEQNYREWEQSIKSKQDSELTHEEQQLKKEIKATQNKDIVFIKEDNGKGYYAGASLDNANTIYIKTEEAKKFGLNRTALHETMESNIRFSNESTQDIIMSTIDDIVNDYSFERQKEEFWKDQDGDMPSDTAIAKDIICDRLAELNGETLDYENVLSDEIKNRIDMSIEYFKKELGNASSFNLPTKADVKKKVNLPTNENIKKGNLLYDIDEGIIKELPTSTRLQSSEGLNSFDETSSFINNSIPQNKNSVKNNTITNNYAQNNENNTMNQPTQETSNEASFNLPTRNDVKTKTNIPINANTKKVKFDSDNLIQESNKMSDEETAQILTEIKSKTNEKRKMSAFLKANLIDKGMIFEELSRKTNNRDLQGKYDYTLTAEARGQNAIGNARYDYQTITKNGKIKKGEKNAKRISKSLTEIIDEVGENPTDFYNYMYHQLNIDRMTLEERFGGDTGINYERKNIIKNKPVFGKGITAEISQKYVQKLEQKYPEFKEYAQDVYDFLDANTKELVDNGVISKETQQLFKEMYPHYVPISRVTNKGQAINVPLDTGRTGVNSPIKRAKGGNGDINPLFQTMADRTLQTYRASARNNFGIELKNTLDKAKQLNQITELTDIDSIMESMTDEEQNNNLLQEGVNGGNPTFTVFENGEKVTYEISKDMYDALKPKNELLKRIDSSMLSKGLNKANNFRRGLLTEYNPVFSITNAIKDAQDVLLNSQHSAKTYSKIPEATAQILSKGYWYEEYIQNGGEQNSYFRDGEFDVTKNTLPTRAKKVITFPLKAISNVNNVIEMTPRLAEYIVSRQQGRSIETSMLDASRVTTNFKAGGDITKTLNRNGFTFLNASVQGMQQQIRNIQEANAKGLKGYAVLATKYAIAGLPALILNNLIWDDDDEYKDLQDYVKDNYYIIGKSKDGTFIRIPKGRAVATIQKIVSNADEFIEEAKSTSILNIDKLGSRFWNDLKEDISFAKDNLAPNNPMDNNILAPIIQAITNKTWYGEELIPSRLQDKPSNEQYDESTDKFSRWLGEKTGISPIKINYLIDQYSGGVGDVLLPIGTPQAENNVIEDKFTTDPTMKSKYPGDFFSKVDELKVNSNSDKATDEDTLKYKYISDVSSDISKLYQKKREIQNSKATDEEKKKQLKEVQKKINDLAMNSLDKVNKITKGKNYAQIDANQYYKDVEGKWKAVSEKDIEKNKKSGLSLKTYSSYKYEMSKVKQEKVNKGEMTKEQNLKDNEQIQILLDSSYSDKDKSTIYENYIKPSVKEGEYDSFKAIKASGININEYLKYEQQEFKSDKKDDGTLDGKTVSKSKQKKVESYLNSMNIEGNQRLLLYAMQGYSTTNSQKNQLANYVYELNLDKETKLELYNKFSGFKVYKDGTIKW